MTTNFKSKRIPLMSVNNTKKFMYDSDKGHNSELMITRSPQKLILNHQPQKTLSKLKDPSSEPLPHGYTIIIDNKVLSKAGPPAKGVDSENPKQKAQQPVGKAATTSSVQIEIKCDEATSDLEYIKILKHALMDVVGQNNTMRMRVMQLEKQKQAMQIANQQKDEALLELAEAYDLVSNGGLSMEVEQYVCEEEEVNSNTSDRNNSEAALPSKDEHEGSQDTIESGFYEYEDMKLLEEK